MDAEFDFRDHVDREPVVVGPFTVTPYAVNHPVEAYGYGSRPTGRCLAYTGDTDECDALDPLCATPTWSSRTPPSSTAATRCPAST